MKNPPRKNKKQKNPKKKKTTKKKEKKKPQPKNTKKKKKKNRSKHSSQVTERPGKNGRLVEPSINCREAQCCPQDRKRGGQTRQRWEIVFLLAKTEARLGESGCRP